MGEPEFLVGTMGEFVAAAQAHSLTRWPPQGLLPADADRDDWVVVGDGKPGNLGPQQAISRGYGQVSLVHAARLAAFAGIVFPVFCSRWHQNQRQRRWIDFHPEFSRKLERIVLGEVGRIGIQRWKRSGRWRKLDVQARILVDIPEERCRLRNHEIEHIPYAEV